MLSGAVDVPPQGARIDIAFEGPVVGQKLRGTVKGVDYVRIRPDGRGQLHIHAEITTEDGKKIALFADGVAIFKDGRRVRGNITHQGVRDTAMACGSAPDAANRPKAALRTTSPLHARNGPASMNAAPGTLRATSVTCWLPAVPVPHQLAKCSQLFQSRL